MDAFAAALQPQLTGWVTYIPFFCRLAAFLLAIPFTFCMALDLVAYGIARTLHLSMLQQRIPRSPPPGKHPLKDLSGDQCPDPNEGLQLRGHASSRSSFASLLSFSSSASQSDRSESSSPTLADHYIDITPTGEHRAPSL